MLILNLAIAAVIDGLQAAQADDERLIKNDSIDSILEAWSYYDPKGTGKMTIEDFYFFLVEIPPPFGQDQHLRQTYVRGEADAAFGMMVNEAKGYMVRTRPLLKALEEVRVKTHREADNKIYVIFNDAFKVLTERAFRRSK